MASPQVEEGHIDIANELAEALAKFPIGFGEGQLIWAILRKTYGWHKKKDMISISQLAEYTGLSRRMVIYGLQNLEAKRVITVQRKKENGDRNEISIIGIQKNYEKWVVQEKTDQYKKALEKRSDRYKKSKELVVQEKGGSARNGVLVVQENENDIPVLAPTKETITKTNTKERYADFFKTFWERYPSRNGKKVEKAESFNRYCRLSEADMALINRAVLHYSSSELVKSGIGIKDPKRFIRDGKGNEPWRDWIEPEKPGEQGEEDWKERWRNPNS